MHEAADELSNRVNTAINLMRDAQGDDTMSLHCRWLLREMMSRVRPDDLSAEEVMGFLAILAPAHNRKLALTNPCRVPFLHTIVDPETGRSWSISDDGLN